MLYYAKKKIVNNNNYNNNNGNNLEMAWIDYRKAYDMVSHSWISEILELVQVSDSILEFVKDQWQFGKQGWSHAEKVWQKLT